MSEEKPQEKRGDLRLQWVVDEDSPEEQRAFAIEEQKLIQTKQVHEDWLRDRAAAHELQERSHQAWVEKNDRANAIFERIAVALEALVRRP